MTQKKTASQEGQDRVRDTDERRADEKRSKDRGSQQGETQHSGTREVTEGTTGGTGVETGGTRNYRSGGGATGTDIGNRPE
jgi:hypothetical protein